MSRVGLSQHILDLKIYIKISKKDELNASNIFSEDIPEMVKTKLDLDY